MLKHLGYVIKVEGLVDANTGTADGALYGAMTGLTIDASIGPTNGAVRIRVDLSNVRSEEENGRLGLSGHPLYAIDNDPGTSSGASGPSGGADGAGGKATAQRAPYSPNQLGQPITARKMIPNGYYSGRREGRTPAVRTESYW